MASHYRIQIVEQHSGRVTSWAPGLEIETEFVTNLCNRVKAKGVGFRTETHVLTDVRAALEELLRDLKAHV